MTDSVTAPVTEVIRHEKNGLLVDFFSSEALANVVCGVLEHPHQMIEIRRQARRAILERFDLWTICLPRQAKLIEGPPSSIFSSDALRLALHKRP
jgi:glycosyltransferase involved in cell wall biosynthesis